MDRYLIRDELWFYFLTSRISDFVLEIPNRDMEAYISVADEMAREINDSDLGPQFWEFLTQCGLNRVRREHLVHSA